MTTMQKVERVLNRLPEVTWDRWMGELEDNLAIGVFGWMPRMRDDDTERNRDFVFLRLDKEGAWLVVTSSPKYSAEFARRLKLGSRKGHTPCRCVESYFPNVKSVHKATP